MCCPEYSILLFNHCYSVHIFYLIVRIKAIKCHDKKLIWLCCGITDSNGSLTLLNLNFKICIKHLGDILTTLYANIWSFLIRGSSGIKLMKNSTKKILFKLKDIFFLNMTWINSSLRPNERIMEQFWFYYLLKNETIIGNTFAFDLGVQII